MKVLRILILFLASDVWGQKPDSVHWSTGETGKDGSRSVYVFKEGSYDRLWGVADRNNKVIIPIVYDHATCFMNGYAIIKKDGKFGYADSTGRIVLEPQFRYALPVNEGLTIVVLADTYHLIDLTGRVIFSSPSISRLAPDRYVVKVNEKVGLMDGNAKFIIPADYDGISTGDSQNRLLVQRNTKKISDHEFSSEWAFFKMNGKRLTAWKKEKYESVPDPPPRDESDAPR
jgi:hypothetical protein